MKIGLCFLLMLAITSCSNKAIEIENLEGYWEISEVVLKDGSKRDYNVNMTVDYIELNSDSLGYRKKLYPKFDGGFNTSEDQENIEVIKDSDRLYIEYTTVSDTWNEDIVFLDKDRLELMNKDSIRYIYKRYTPLNLE